MIKRSEDDPILIDLKHKYYELCYQINKLDYSFKGTDREKQSVLERLKEEAHKVKNQINERLKNNKVINKAS